MQSLKCFKHLLSPMTSVITNALLPIEDLGLQPGWLRDHGRAQHQNIANAYERTRAVLVKDVSEWCLPPTRSTVAVKAHLKEFAVILTKSSVQRQLSLHYWKDFYTVHLMEEGGPLGLSRKDVNRISTTKAHFLLTPGSMMPGPYSDEMFVISLRHCFGMQVVSQDLTNVPCMGNHINRNPDDYTPSHHPAHPCTCPSNGRARSARHDDVRDVIIEVCRNNDVAGKIEEIHHQGQGAAAGSRKRTDGSVFVAGRRVQFDTMIVDPCTPSALAQGGQHGGMATLVARAALKNTKHKEPLARLSIGFFPFIISCYGVIEDQGLALLKLLVNQMAGTNRSRAARVWRELYLRIGATIQIGNARCYLRWVEQQGGQGGILVPPPRWMSLDWDEFEFEFLLNEEDAQQRNARLVRTFA